MLFWSGRAFAQSASPWKAVDVAIGSDLKPRLLWTHPDGRMALWTLGSTGAVEAANNQGPYSGWTARKVAVGPDGKAVVMWTSTSGQLALHRINAQGVLEAHQEYGPFSDGGGTWSATTMSVDALNQPRVVWRCSDGYTSVWTVNTALSMVSQNFFGPFAGWTLDKIGFDSANKGRFTWNNTDGHVDLWVTTPATAFESVQHYAPSAGWSPYSLCVAGDGSGWLGWGYSDQRVALWHLDGAGSQTDTKFFGPYSGWQSKGTALYPSPNNRLRVLWQYANGGINLWNTDPSGVPDSNLTNVYNAPPSGLSATGAVAKITLNWSATPNTTGYNIYRAASSSGPWSVLGSATSATYTDTSAAGGSTYFYQVTAATGGVESGRDSTVNATANVAPTPTPTATPTPTPTPLPLLSVSNASVNEGNSGLTPLPFVASLSSASSQNVTFSYSTVAGTATADVDYVSASGTFTIPAGQTSATVNVSINGDTTVEPNETLTLTLSSIVGARLASGTTVSATGTIVDDDVAPTPTPTPTATPDPNAVQAPTNLYVVSTGNGKNTLYWRQVPTAVGYYVFRSTSSGGENYSSPVGSAMVLSESSYSGSPLRMWTDTGLTNGTEYFYTVKATISDGTQSNPSNEDSDVVDPQGTPWDSRNTSLILNSAASAINATAPSTVVPVEGGEAFEVTGPDGVTYISGQADPQPPTLLYNPTTKGYMLPDGTPFALSSDTDASSSSSSLVQSEGGEIGGSVLGGAYRGAITSTGYWACMFQIQLPTTASNNVSISSYGKTAHDDHPVVYLGSSAKDARGGAGVDAGLLYGASASDNPPNSKWHFYLQAFGGPEVASYSKITFSPGERVSLLYCLEKKGVGKSTKVYATLSIQNFSSGKKVCKALQVGHHNRDFSNVKVKRNEQMAQEEKGANGSHNGQPIIGSHIELDGSYMLGFDWFDGQVFPYSSPGHLWGLSDTPSTGVASWPNSSISYYDQTHSHPYDVESNVCVDLSNPMG